MAVVRKKKHKSGENVHISCANAPPDRFTVFSDYLERTFPHDWSRMSKDQLNMLDGWGDGAKQEKMRRVSNGNDK